MLGRKSLTLFIGEWITYGLLLLSNIVLARAVGPDVIGRIGFAFGLIGIFVMFTGLGFGTAHIKRIAEGYPLGLGISTYALITLILNLLSLAVCSAAWFFLLNGLFESSNEKVAFILFFIYQIALNLSSIFTATFNGRTEFAKVAMVNIAGKFIRFIGIVLAVVYFPNILAIGVVFLIDGLTQIVIGFFLLPRPLPILRPTAASFISYWKYAKPLAILAPLGVFGDSVDRVVLRKDWPASEVGYYNVARTLFEPIKTIASAAVTALFPKFTEDYAKSGEDILKVRFQGALRKLLLIATPFTVLGVFFSRAIITLLYGPKFASAVVPLEIFFGVSWIISLFSLFHYLIYAIEKHRIFLWASPLGQGCYFLGLLLLTGRGFLGLGAVGAALASSLPMIVSSVPIILHAKKTVGIKFPYDLMLKFILAGALMALILYLLFTFSENIFLRILFAAVSLVAYWFTLVSLKRVSREDFFYFMDLINLKKLVKYIYSDVKLSK